LGKILSDVAVESYARLMDLGYVAVKI